jgi:hypothetical protein
MWNIIVLVLEYACDKNLTLEIIIYHLWAMRIVIQILFNSTLFHFQ